MKVHEQVLIERLRMHNLYITRNRIKILDWVYATKGVVSTGTIARCAGSSFDRISIYRTIQVFWKKGILMQVPSTNTVMEFILVNGSSTEAEKHAMECIFLCSKCRALRKINAKVLLEAAHSNSQLSEVILKGICMDCID